MAKQHNTKEVARLFRQMEKMGFVIVKKKGGGYKIYPPQNVNGPAYHTHGTAQCVKPIIRDFRKMYGIDLAAWSYR